MATSHVMHKITLTYGSLPICIYSNLRRSHDHFKYSERNWKTQIRNFSKSNPTKSSEDVLISIENGVKKIILNRAKARNALSYNMVERIGTAFHDSNSDDSIKLVTITGTGDFFSSGNDLMNWHTGANQTMPEIKEKLRTYVLRLLMYEMIDCKKPIVALVNGGAVGAGATMLPLCDQVVASDKAFFHTPFTAIGIVPEFCSSYTFPKIMGYAKGNDMLLFGHQMSAKEALECGFVSKVFPASSFEDSCKKLIDNYSKLPLKPLMMGKEMIRAQERQMLRHLCAYEMDYVIDATENPLLRAILDKFFSKKG